MGGNATDSVEIEGTSDTTTDACRRLSDVAREELDACSPVAIYQSVRELDRDYERSVLADQWVVNA